MRTLKLHLAILIITVVYGGNVYAVPGNQRHVAKPFVADVDSMKNKLEKEKDFSANIFVVNKNVAGFMPSISAVIHRSGELTYYKILHLEYLFAEHYSVIVNHKAHSIAYAGKDKKGSAINKMSVLAWDTVLSQYDSVVYQGLINGTRKYIIYNKHGLIDKCDAFFNPQYMFFTRLVYHYNHEILGEEATIEVNYKDIKYKPLFNSSEFSESRFLLKKGKKFEPVQPLHGYSVTEGKVDFGEYF